MYTSCYTKHGSDPLAVAISRRPPENYQGKTAPELAPTWEMVMAYKRSEINADTYTQLYLNLLMSRNLTPEKIYNTYQNNILLCYEQPKQFCHRRVLAEWLEKNLGVEVHEKSLAPKAAEQLKLFDW